MAFNKTPTEWIAGIVVDGAFLKIPLTSLPQLATSEVTGAGADIRKVLFAILDAIAVSFASKTIEDRPTKFTATRSTSLPAEFTDKIVRNYNFTTELDVSGVEVVAEPQV
jgi:hypothetical protein